MFSECGVYFAAFDVICDVFDNGVWMFVCCSLCVSVCMLTVSNALLMSTATVIVRYGGLFWLMPVAMVLFMLCSAVLVEWLLLKPCFMEICVMLFVMYGMGVVSSPVFLLSLREVRWVWMMFLCSCLCLVLELELE